MAKYVDGFVLLVPKKNLDAYKKMATLGKKICLKHGALDYKECVGDDLHPNMGPEAKAMKAWSFPAMTKQKDDEVILFSFIVYRSKAHRDAVNAKVMKDPAMKPEDVKDMPFEMKRMAFGGFNVLVDA